jgi:hypothetical protein
VDRNQEYLITKKESISSSTLIFRFLVRLYENTRTFSGVREERGRNLHGTESQRQRVNRNKDEAKIFSLFFKSRKCFFMFFMQTHRTVH